MDKGIVYEWTNLVNNKKYIGSHKGSAHDGYTASGKLIKYAFDKYGMDNFIRRVLYFGKDYKELEEFCLEEVDAMNNENYYNLHNFSSGGFTKEVAIKAHYSISKEDRKKINIKAGNSTKNRGVGMFDKRYEEKRLNNLRKSRCRNIIITDKNTDIKLEFNSITEMVDTMGLSKSGVYATINNGPNRYKKYIIKYKENK